MDTKILGVDVEILEHSRESVTVRTRFDQGRASASLAVVASLAEVLDVDPIELPPLQSVIDTDALDALVRGGHERNGNAAVTFTHEGREIRVDGDGVVRITSADVRT